MVLSISLFAAFADAALTVMADLYQPSARWTPRYACGVALEELPTIAAERGDVEAGLRRACIRETILAEIDDYSGVTLESLVAEIENILGDSLSAEELALAAEVFAANTGENPRFRRNPTQDDWCSWVETAVVRVPQHTEKRYEKGDQTVYWDDLPSYRGWSSLPELVVWDHGWKTLQEAASFLMRLGMSREMFADSLKGKVILEDGIPIRRKPFFPGRSAANIKANLPDGVEFPIAVDRPAILAVTPFTGQGGKKLKAGRAYSVPTKGQEYLSVVVHPDLGVWREHGEALRLFCRMAKVPLALRIIVSGPPSQVGPVVLGSWDEAYPTYGVC